MSKFGISAQTVEPIAGCSERKPTLTARRRQHLPIFHSDHRPPVKEEAVLPDFSSTMSPTSTIFCGAMRKKTTRSSPRANGEWENMGHSHLYYKMGDSPQPHCRRDPEGSGGYMSEMFKMRLGIREC